MDDWMADRDRVLARLSEDDRTEFMANWKTWHDTPSPDLMSILCNVQKAAYRACKNTANLVEAVDTMEDSSKPFGTTAKYMASYTVQYLEDERSARDCLNHITALSLMFILYTRWINDSKFKNNAKWPQYRNVDQSTILHATGTARLRTIKDLINKNLNKILRTLQGIRDQSNTDGCTLKTQGDCASAVMGYKLSAVRDKRHDKKLKALFDQTADTLRDTEADEVRSITSQLDAIYATYEAQATPPFESLMARLDAVIRTLP